MRPMEVANSKALFVTIRLSAAPRTWTNFNNGSSADSYFTVFLSNATKSAMSDSVVSNEVINLTSEISSFQT